MDPQCYRLLAEVEDVHWWHVGMRRIALRWLRRAVPSGARLLDVGCGTGRLLRDLQREGVAVGVDVSPWAARLWAERGQPGVARARVQALPFPTGAFDAVVCLDVLYHAQVPDETSALAEIARVLRPGGVVLIRVPALPWLRSSRDVPFYTRRRYSPRDLQTLLSSVELRLERQSYANALLLPLAILQRRLGSHVTPCENLGDRVPIPVINWLARCALMIEERWLDRWSFPIGLSLICLARRM
ncbi:MAG: class I SAM-dependent methyltransferase [Anaerolineae bacterium]